MTVQEAIDILTGCHPDAELYIAESCCAPVPIGEVMGAYERNVEAPEEWSFTILGGMKDEKAVLFEGGDE